VVHVCWTPKLKLFNSCVFLPSYVHVPPVNVDISHSGGVEQTECDMHSGDFEEHRVRYAYHTVGGAITTPVVVGSCSVTIALLNHPVVRSTSGISDR
jgi:hypothetical protein